MGTPPKFETTTGGYIFVPQVFNDNSVPPKWQNHAKLTSKQAVLDVIEEEAAYTFGSTV
jgi:hypothetical protein